MTDRYWDTVCFLGVLNEEQDKLSPCRAVLGEAERGNVRIVTSALTIAEVLWPKGRPLILAREKAAEVQRFFQHEWIVVRDIDRAVAESTRACVGSRGAATEGRAPVGFANSGGLVLVDESSEPVVAV